VPALGILMVGRWMNNLAVRIEMIKLGAGREFKLTRWRHDPLSEDNPWRPYGVRHQTVEHSDVLFGWLSAMESKPTDTVTVHIGTNVLDGDLSERPRIVDQINQKSVRDDWRATWTRLFDEGHTSLASKSLVWDIDDPEDLETAFETADAIAAELSKHVSMPEQAPRVVFSGGKGFHVWVVDESAIKHLCQSLVGADVESMTPKNRAAAHREVVKEISRRATGWEIPHLDQAPNHRQGIIRCPYAVHERTGQIVWPLDIGELERLREGDGIDWSSPVALAKSIHPWEIPVQSPMAEALGVESTWIHPEANVKDRGMPAYG
jgi:hypothetical protein